MGGVAERHDPGARGDGAGLGDEGRRIEGLDRRHGHVLPRRCDQLGGRDRVQRQRRHRQQRSDVAPSGRGGRGAAEPAHRPERLHPRERAQRIGLAPQRLPDAAHRRVRGVRDRRVLRSRGATRAGAAGRPWIPGCSVRRPGAPRRRRGSGAPSNVARSTFAAMKPPMAPSSEHATSEGERGIGPGALHERRLQEPPPALRGPGVREPLGQQLGDPRQVCVVERAHGCHGTELP